MIRPPHRGQSLLLGRTLIVLGVIAALLAGRLLTEEMLRYHAEDLLTNSVGTKVQIGGVSIRLLESSVVLEDVKVSNPEGYSQPYFGESESIVFTGSISSIIHGPLHIRVMDFRNLKVWLLKNHGHYNYRDLLNGSDPQAEASAKPDVIIDEIVMQNVHAEVHTLSHSSLLPDQLNPESLGIFHVKFQEIEIRDIGLDGGKEAATRQLSALITRALVTASARKAGLLPLLLVGDGFQMGKTTLKIIEDPQKAGTFLNDPGRIERGAAEWLHRVEKDSESVIERTGK